MLIALTLLSLALGIYYYRILFASIICYIFWNYVLSVRFPIPQVYLYECFIVLLTIYFIIIVIRGAFGKVDLTLEKFLK